MNTALLVIFSFVPNMTQTQDVSPAERAMVESAVRSAILASVKPDWQERVLSRLQFPVDSSLARWSKSEYGFIRFNGPNLSVEFRLGMDQIMRMNFRCRENWTMPVEGEEPLSEAELREKAKAVTNEQLDGYWQVGDTTTDRADMVSVRFNLRPIHAGLAFSRIARVTIDRFTGCVTGIDKDFASLPRVAKGEGLVVSPADRELLRSVALDAYYRYQPLDQGTIRASDVSYEFPLFERHANEMTEEHRQIARDQKVMPIYRIGIEGVRAGRPLWVEVFVDAMTKRAMAITEMYLDDNIAFNASGPPVPKAPAFEEFKTLTGKSLALTFEAVLLSELAADQQLLVQTKDDGLVRLAVDITKRLLFVPENELRVYKPSADTWKVVLEEVKRPRVPFGKPKTL